MTQEKGSFIGMIKDSYALRQEALERALSYDKESGLNQIAVEFNEGKSDPLEKVRKFTNLNQSIVFYRFPVNGDKFFYVVIDSVGEIKFRGHPLRGCSEIKRKDWLKKPELIDKGMIKAFRHPDDDWE